MKKLISSQQWHEEMCFLYAFEGKVYKEMSVFFMAFGKKGHEEPYFHRNYCNASPHFQLVIVTTSVCQSSATDGPYMTTRFIGNCTWVIHQIGRKFNLNKNAKK